MAERRLRIFVFIGMGADPAILSSAPFRRLRRHASLLAGTELPDSFLRHSVDVLVVPGGVASELAATLGSSGREQILRYVAEGGNYLGKCRHGKC